MNDHIDEHIDTHPEDNMDELPYDGAGFPGCGDGSDDLADLMAYGDEGCCDTGYDE